MANVTIFADYNIEYDGIGYWFRGLVDKTTYLLSSYPIMAFNLNGTIRWGPIKHPVNQGGTGANLEIWYPAIGETELHGCVWSNSEQNHRLVHVDLLTGATYYQIVSLQAGTQYDTCFFTPNGRIILTQGNTDSFYELVWSGSSYNVLGPYTYFPGYDGIAYSPNVCWRFVPGENAMYYHTDRILVKWDTTTFQPLWSKTLPFENGRSSDSFVVKQNGNPVFMYDIEVGTLLRVTEVDKTTGNYVDSVDVPVPFEYTRVDNMAITKDDILYVRFKEGYWATIGLAPITLLHWANGQHPHTYRTYANASFVEMGGTWWGYSEIPNPNYSNDYNNPQPAILITLFSYNGQNLKKYDMPKLTSDGNISRPSQQSSLMPKNGLIYVPSGGTVLLLNPHAPNASPTTTAAPTTTTIAPTTTAPTTTTVSTTTTLAPTTTVASTGPFTIDTTSMSTGAWSFGQAYDGRTNVIASPDINDGENTGFLRIIFDELRTSGSFSFDYVMQGEIGYDGTNIYAFNDTEQTFISPSDAGSPQPDIVRYGMTSSWTNIQLIFNHPTREFRLRYFKDGSVSQGFDGFKIDVDSFMFLP